MNVNKDQIINGIIKYIKTDILVNIPDKNFRTIATAAVLVFANKPEILNNIFSNPVVKMLETANGYDIDALSAALKEAFAETGGITITIPPVKFLMPEQKELKFSSNDIDAIVKNIKGDI